MENIVETLLTIPFFKVIPRHQVEASVRFWSSRWFDMGDTLWVQGADVYEMALVISGDLEAVVDSLQVARIGPGEMVGEASVFLAGSTRTATLRALSGGHLLTLSVDGLRALRRSGSELYNALLEQALSTLARRVRQTNVQIAQITRGNAPAPVRAEPSLLARLWKTYRPGSNSSACPRIEPLLARIPGLAGTAPEQLRAISQAFTPVAMEEGQVIFLEGDSGNASYLIAEGEVDVLRHVRGDRAEALAKLKKGDQFGLNTLVESGSRTASCVAATEGWLYRMDTSAYVTLKGEARLLWQEVVLASFASQIRNANRTLRRYLESENRVKRAQNVRSSLTNLPILNKQRADLEARMARAEAAEKVATARKEDAFAELLKASGYLEALPVNKKELGNVKVVVSEDQRRMRRKG